MTTPVDSAAVKAAAARAGFHKAGVARAERLDAAPLDRLLALGGEADMTWLRTQREERLDPGRLLPGARSVLALAVSYHAGEPEPVPPGAGEVARYARGRDYHGVMRRKLKGLVAELSAAAPEARFLATADIAPVMEKAWAERAGIGWIGKNGCLLTAEFGSWVLLATVLTDLALEPDAPHPERCGSCTACLPACPTAAIVAPGVVDARRCISFWTIERRGPIPGAMAGELGTWVFGCDACQAVCPWNAGLAPSSDADLVPLPSHAALDIDELLALDERAYARRFHGTAFARARLDGLVRNAALHAGRSGDRRHLPALRRLLASPHVGVAAAAAWALARLGEGG